MNSTLSNRQISRSPVPKNSNGIGSRKLSPDVFVTRTSGWIGCLLFPSFPRMTSSSNVRCIFSGSHAMLFLLYKQQGILRRVHPPALPEIMHHAVGIVLDDVLGLVFILDA